MAEGGSYRTRASRRAVLAGAHGLLACVATVAFGLAQTGCPRGPQTEDEMITLAHGDGSSAPGDEQVAGTIGEATADAAPVPCSPDGFCMVLGRGVRSGPSAEAGASVMQAVWGSGPDDVYAVGLQGRLLHFDGNELRNLTGRVDINDLWGVWGSGPDSVVVAGNNGVVSLFDGEGWQNQSVGFEFPLFGVWGASATDVFVVGGPRAVMRNEGRGWREERIPRFNASSDEPFRPALWSVWGTGPDNVYAVGDAGWIMRYDGRRWRNLESSTTADLKDVGGATEGEVWVVGEGGTALRSAGGGFVPVGPRTDADLNGVWVGGWNEVYVVGSGGVIFHHNGRTWRSVDSGVEEDLHDIWGHGDDLWIVGDGVILRRSGSAG